MITELVEKLNEIKNEFVFDGRTCKAIWVGRAINTIDELSAKLQSANMDWSSQYYNVGWISVKDRLPEPQKDGDSDYSDWVLITLHIGSNNDVVGRAYYCFSEETWCADRFGVGEVTAWCELPPAYKAESEE